MLKTEVLNKLKGLMEDDGDLVEVKVKDVSFKFGVLTVAEEIMVRSLYDQGGETPSPDEIMIEQLVYALRYIDGEPIRATELSSEVVAELRQLLAGLPRVIVRQMHTKLLFAELEQETRVGLQQLRQILLSTGFLQLVPLIPFPVTLKELAEALARSSSMEEAIEQLQGLEGKYVEAMSPETSEDTNTGEEEVSEEKPVPSDEEVIEESVSEAFEEVGETSNVSQPTDASDMSPEAPPVESNKGVPLSREAELARKLTEGK